MVRHMRDGAAYSSRHDEGEGEAGHDAADIVCEECKSILVTLHAPSAARTGVRTKKAAKASEMAAQEIDRLIDPSAPDEERQRRKRRLLKGPKSSEMSAAAIAQTQVEWALARCHDPAGRDHQL